MKSVTLAVTGLALAATVGCATVSRERYDTDIVGLKKQLKELETKNASLFGDKGTLQGALDRCTSEANALKSSGKALDANLSNALKRIQELENIAAAQKAVFDKLRAQLDGLVQAGKLTVSIVRGQFTVQMADKILFDSGKFEVKDAGKETLVELTRILGSLSGRSWQVSGHTDADGGDDYNWRLSGNRSKAVIEFMIENGMPPDRISFAGYGKHAPAAPNDTPENKALNRRIEIVLIPDLDALLAPFQPKTTP